MEYYQRGHFDFDRDTYEGLRSKYPEAAEQIKELCIRSLQSGRDLDAIEAKIEEMRVKMEQNPSSEDSVVYTGLEDEYYQHLKEMDWAIIFDINKDGTTSVRALDTISTDEAHPNSDNIAAEYIFSPSPDGWLDESIDISKTASEDMSWMNEVNKVTKPGVNVETPYGKVFVHPQKGRRYIKKKDGVIESLPRFLLSLNGINIPKGQDIHHKDENKLNDSIDNYAYDEHHDHAREHLNFTKKKSNFILPDLETFIKLSEDLGIGTGKGQYVNIDDVPKDELVNGIKTEVEEHHVSPADGLSIALDHEAENLDITGEDDYYRNHSDIDQMLKATNV